MLCSLLWQKTSRSLLAPDGFQVIGYVLNLTNEVFGFYQGSEQFPIQREYYNRTFAGGLRWALGRENK